MAGRGRGKTLPAWMTNGDTNVSASLSSTNGAPIMGQFSDARESQKADTFQAQPGSSSLEVSSMGRDHFQPQNSNGLEQFLAQGNQFQQQPPFGRDKFPMQGGPTPPQGPHPRGMPGRYDMPSSPLFAPPRPAIQVGQGSDLNPPDFKHPMQGNFNPQMASSGIALGMSGIAPMMNFPRPLPQQQPHMQQQLQLQQQPQMQLQMQQPLMQQQPQMQQLQQMQQLPQIQQQQHQYPLNQLAAQQPQLQQQQFSQSSALMGMGIGMAMGGNVPGQGAVAGHGSVVGMGAPGSYNFQQSAGVGMPAAMLAGAAGRGMPLQTAVGPLGLGLPGSFPQAMGRGLLNGALPRVPMPAPAPAAVGDPNNEVSSWSEHEAEDKRKYWYNRVTGTSTYDKPFCLKTPEERSIPPCKWKEYTASDGKKYYSDGKESR